MCGVVCSVLLPFDLSCFVGVCVCGSLSIAGCCLLCVCCLLLVACSGLGVLAVASFVADCPSLSGECCMERVVCCVLFLVCCVVSCSLLAVVDVCC